MTLALRTRLAAISSILFGTLLAGFSVASYEILARRLDADASERLAELTDGLHGYLKSLRAKIMTDAVSSRAI